MGFDFDQLENMGIQLIDGDRGKKYPKHQDFSDTGYCLFLSAKNVTKRGFEFGETFYISEEKDRSLRAGKIRRGDLVLTTRGTIGNVAYYGVQIPFENIRINSGMMIIRVDQDKWNPKLLYFIFTSPYLKQQVESLTTGSAVPQLPARDLKKFLLPSIPRSYQDRIEFSLSSIDNKIQLNRETNQTLEAMAQALFKSWFVDFDPVFDNIIAHNLAHNNEPLHNIPEPLLPHAQRRLKAHNVGRGSARQTASHAFHHLFPQAFEQSDEPSVGIQGWVPKGWGVKKIKDFGRVVTGKTPPKSITDAFTDVGFPFITPTDIDNSIYVTKVNRSLSDAGILPLAKNKLPSGSICVTCIGSQMGKTVLSPGEAFTNQQINSVIPYDVENKNYLFMHLRERRDEIFSLGASGSTMPILNKTSFENMSILGSKTTLMKQFTSLTDSYLNGILEKEKQISNLESLRDTLLPKLISGELRIPDAEQASEALAK